MPEWNANKAQAMYSILGINPVIGAMVVLKVYLVLFYKISQSPDLTAIFQKHVRI